MRPSRPRPSRVAALLALGAILTAGGCSAAADDRPVIGAPAPIEWTEPDAAATPRASTLSVRWHLSGATLPDDWPDLPLPEQTRVVTAYGVGTGADRSWTGTFTSESGTAADLARPVVAKLRKLEFETRTQYLGADRTNSGIFSLSSAEYEVFIVLGEDAGRPSVAVTIRRPSPVETPNPSAGGPTLPSGD